MPAKLYSEIVPIASVPPLVRSEAFALFQRHYDHVSFEQFDRDFSGKQWVVLLREKSSCALKGFSTQQVFTYWNGLERVRVLFSGDTIIDPEFWGEQELVKGWCRFAGTQLALEPETPLYWLLISKGYRTYLFLPLFYREYYPHRERATPPTIQELLDDLARYKFGPFYHPETGRLEFPESLGQLNAVLAAIPEARKNHPEVQFFLQKNPGYAHGSELVCLARIHPENMRSIARQAVLDGMASARASTPLPEVVEA